MYMIIKRAYALSVWLLLPGILFLAFMSQPAIAQEKGVSETQLEDLLKIHAPDELVAKQVREKGLAFRTTPSIVQKFKHLGAGPLLIAQLQQGIQTGDLVIHAKPGCTLTVDGKNVGVTNARGELVVKGLTAGDHTIAAPQVGSNGTTLMVNLAAHQTTSVNLSPSGTNSNSANNSNPIECYKEGDRVNLSGKVISKIATGSRGDRAKLVGLELSQPIKITVQILINLGGAKNDPPPNEEHLLELDCDYKHPDIEKQLSKLDNKYVHISGELFNVPVGHGPSIASYGIWVDQITVDNTPSSHQAVISNPPMTSTEAWLTVRAIPSDTSIEIIGPTRMHGLVRDAPCKPGTYTIQATRTGWSPITEQMTIRVGDHAVEEIRLKPGPEIVAGLLKEAVALNQSMDFQGAIRRGKEILAMDPDNSDACKVIAEAGYYGNDLETFLVYGSEAIHAGAVVQVPMQHIHGGFLGRKLHPVMLNISSSGILFTPITPLQGCKLDKDIYLFSNMSIIQAQQINGNSLLLHINYINDRGGKNQSIEFAVMGAKIATGNDIPILGDNQPINSPPGAERILSSISAILNEIKTGRQQ